MHKKKIAIVYDRINKFGGAERVLLALRQAFPDSTLVTSVYDPEGAAWIADWKIRTTWLQRLPLARRHHEWFGWLMPLAFESLDLSDFDVIISVTSEAAKGVITNTTQTHICYCLTPTRYLWSHTHAYEQGHLAGIKRAVFSYLRGWDYIAAQRPDMMIAISELVAKRLRKYYQREADRIIYPPVSLPASDAPVKQKDGYLVVSRLVPYKRVDLAIAVCLKLGKTLRIVGSGSDLPRLQNLAAGSPLVQFVGQVSDAELVQEYQSALALICPQEEDFGIVAVEAQGLGTPVISHAKSGVAETLVDGKTGILFNEPTVDSLAEALLQFEKLPLNRQEIVAQASRFGEARFVKEIRDIVELC